MLEKRRVGAKDDEDKVHCVSGSEDGVVGGRYGEVGDNGYSAPSMCAVVGKTSG